MSNTVVWCNALNRSPWNPFSNCRKLTSIYIALYWQYRVLSKTNSAWSIARAIICWQRCFVLFASDLTCFKSCLLLPFPVLAAELVTTKQLRPISQNILATLNMCFTAGTFQSKALGWMDIFVVRKGYALAGQLPAQVPDNIIGCIGEIIGCHKRCNILCNVTRSLHQQCITVAKQRDFIEPRNGVFSRVRWWQGFTSHQRETLVNVIDVGVLLPATWCWLK